MMSLDFQKLQALFEEAIEKHGPETWDQYVDDVCGDDPELRLQLRQLLHAHRHGAIAFETPLPRFETTEILPVTEQAGDDIGPYKLLQPIGEGGMGTVFMAEQSVPIKRRVALKIIKPGMDSQQVIARFEAERQALAMMDHPHIAKVLDAGTTDTGRPYFVMELVKGVPITTFCDEQHLPPRERLELFLPVCQAVQHAHQKGIIHRDLKPSNILVAQYDNKPVPKVIDFGVAKAISHNLTEKTMFTQYGTIVGTFEYMSPEQATFNQLDVDTRSDVYSLGVLLYELLTGETPFDKRRLRSAAFDELLRILREEEPPKPSLKLSSSESLPSIAANRRIEPQKLSTLVRGELDWVVMKALEKDRNRRYESASAFAEDIHHYLNHEAVTACPPSTGYRLKKFLRRNRTFLMVAGTIGLVLLIATAVSSVMAVQATHARNDARNQEQIALDAVGKADREREKAKAESRRADRARLESDIAKYAYQIRLADSNFSRVNGTEALEILESTDPKMRGWEYGRLKALWNARRGMFDEAREYKCVAISPDGEFVAGGGDDGEVRLFDFMTKQPAGVLKTGGTRVTSLAFSADGKYLAASSDSSAHLWEVESRRIVGEVSFPPPPKRILTEEEQRVPPGIKLPRGIRVFEFNETPAQVPLIALNPRGEKIAVVVQGEIQLWNSTLTEKLREIPIRQEDETYAFVKALAFHPQHSQLLVNRHVRVPVTHQKSPAPPDKTRFPNPQPEDEAQSDFRLLDTESGETIVRSRPVKAGDIFFERGSLQFEKSGSWFLSGTAIRDMKTCEFLREIPTGTVFNEFVSLCDDRMQAAISHSFHDGVTIVDLASGKLAHRLSPVRKLSRGIPMGHYVSCVAISADGRRIVSGFSEPPLPDTPYVTERKFARGLIGWNLDDSVTVETIGGSGTTAETDGNGISVKTTFLRYMFPVHADWFARVVRTDRIDLRNTDAQQAGQTTPPPTTSHVEFLSLKTGETLFILAERQGRLPLNVACSRDGRWMACWTGEKIEIWNVPERRLIQSLSGPGGSVREILVDPSGRYLAVLVYDSDHAKFAATPGDGPPPPNNEPQAVPPANYFYEFFLWNLSTGKVISSEKGKGTHDEPMDSIGLLAFHPSGDRLIRTRQMHSLPDGSDILNTTKVMEVMETSSGEILSREEVPCTVDSACFLRDGSKLYYAAKYEFTEPGQQPGIWLWDLETDRRTRLHSQPVSSLAISPDESRLLFMSGVHSTVNRTLVLMETETHHKVFEMPVNQNSGTCAFTADGGILIHSPTKPVERLLVEHASEQ